MTLHLENLQTSICLGRWTIDFTRMREWKWLFMNGCKCKMPVCISTGFWKLCKCGTTCINVLKNSAGKQLYFFAGNEPYLTLWCFLVYLLLLLLLSSSSKGSSVLLNTIHIEFCGANPPSDANSLTGNQMNHLLRNPKVCYHVAVISCCKIHFNIILSFTRRSSKRFPSVSLSDNVCVRTSVWLTV
jgi:hypothetical protein